MISDELKEKLKEELKQHYIFDLRFDYNGNAQKNKTFNENSCLEAILKIINEENIK